MCHAGFGDEIYFYCDHCGMAASVDIYTKEMENGKFYERFYNLSTKKDFHKMKMEIIKFLKECGCGGKFTVEATPKCPICLKELEWNKIVDQLDKNSNMESPIPDYASKNIKKEWKDIYYFVFNNRLIRNNWNIKKFL